MAKSDENRATLERFASQFSPPLNIIGTERIGGDPVRDGFMCAAYDKKRQIGLTGVCWTSKSGKQRFKAWLEAVDSVSAAEVGVLFSAVMNAKR